MRRNLLFYSIHDWFAIRFGTISLELKIKHSVDEQEISNVESTADNIKASKMKTNCFIIFPPLSSVVEYHEEEEISNNEYSIE